MVTFIPRRKQKKKKKTRKKKPPKETKPIFESSYLGNAWHNLLEIWKVGY